MDDALRAALGRSQVIDLTTTGARTGLARRVEIVLHNFDGGLYLSGMPNRARKRSWLANIEANPAITIHLKGALPTDLPATARAVADATERRTILEKVARVWNRTDVTVMVEHSPLVEVSIPGYPTS